MFKLGCGAFSLICLLVAAFVLWQSPSVPGNLPSTLADWTVMWFRLFRNPVAAVTLFALCTAFAVAAAGVTELILGIAFSLVAAVLSMLCVLGVLGAQYPGVAQSVEKFLR
jgi:hypothetical protein